MSLNSKTFFFCGIGGSGMMPLAAFLRKRGAIVYGSDRSYDQGKMPEKFDALKEIGVELFPQDGSGFESVKPDRLVVSSAVEETIPDVRAALANGIEIIKRGALLAELFNEAKCRIAVAGTSGKSTVTGMTGTIFAQSGQTPSVVNGGEVVNFRQNDNDRFSNILVGDDAVFIAEMDESDGSIAHYMPDIAVLNNIAIDHKTMEELETLFGDYLACAKQAVVVNWDHPRVKALCDKRAKARIVKYGIDNDAADLNAHSLVPKPFGIDFKLSYEGNDYPVSLNVPGQHNVENALSAIGAALCAGLGIYDAIDGLKAFRGIHRRMEYIGEKNGITVIDDFGHNPDKISASLRSLKAFDGRLIVMFQPHGFGPLRMMGNEIVDAFAAHMDQDDILLMPEVYYAGGSVDRSVTAADIIERLKKRGVNASWFEVRSDIAPFIADAAQSGDRVIIMGARDDTLHIFAKDILSSF